MMTNARKELADLIWRVETRDLGGVTLRDSEAIADAIMAAGWRKLRTITTAEERQALDPLAVVMWIDDAGLPHTAIAAAVQAWTNSARHPMTVLWTPEVDQ